MTTPSAAQAAHPERPLDTPWHTLPGSDAAAALGTSVGSGLSVEAARDRFAEHGPNELAERDQKSVWRMLWEQLSATLVVVLIVAAVVSAALGDFTDAVAILAIVVLNTILGLFHEHRAERAMAMLKRLAVPIVRAQRDGSVVELPARDLVPGDIVLLEAGNLVPADCRLLECANLRAQEASLTGESEPVDKIVPGPARCRPAARRPPQHGLHGHDRHLRPRPGRCGGDGHAHRTRPHRRPDPDRRARADASAEAPGPARPRARRPLRSCWWPSSSPWA